MSAITAVDMTVRKTARPTQRRRESRDGDLLVGGVSRSVSTLIDLSDDESSISTISDGLISEYLWLHRENIFNKVGAMSLPIYTSEQGWR